MKQIETVSLRELREGMHIHIIKPAYSFCGLPFMQAVFHTFCVRLEVQVPSRIDGSIEVWGLKAVGISSANMICFKARIDFESSDLELDTPTNPNERKFYADVIGRLIGRAKAEHAKTLKVLIFTDLISEKSIMIADDGRYEMI